MATKKIENKVTEKKVTTKATEKKEAVKTEKKVTEKKVTEKANKEVKVITIGMEELMKELEKVGIKVYNPTAKGNYRIFGNKKGSSMHIHKTEYIVFSTDDDYKAVSDAKIIGVEAIEKGNAQDHCRPHKVVFSTPEALKAVLTIYAKNPLNQVAKA